MIKIISHRGNLSGKTTDENKTSYIDAAISESFDVEVDVWMVDNTLYLGHDEPQYKISSEWIEKRKNFLWIHAKNKDALSFCLNNNFHVFWHNTDDYTITSRGYVWAFPGKYVSGNLCVGVLPELHWTISETYLQNFFGVCTDYPTKFLTKS